MAVRCVVLTVCPFLVEASVQEMLGSRGSQFPSQRPLGCPFLATHHEVSGHTRVGMPEVDGVHIEGLLQLVLVLDPVGFQMGISS